MRVQFREKVCWLYGFSEDEGHACDITFWDFTCLASSQKGVFCCRFCDSISDMPTKRWYICNFALFQALELPVTVFRVVRIQCNHYQSWYGSSASTPKLVIPNYFSVNFKSVLVMLHGFTMLYLLLQLL